MTEFENEAESLLLLTTARISRLQDQVLGSLSAPLTSRQYRVVSRVKQGYTAPTVLARLARRSVPTVSETIDGLVRRNLLKRSPDVDDRRVVVLSVTKEGERALREADRRMKWLSDELIGVLDPSDVESLTRHLAVLYQAAENYLEPREP